MATQHAGEQRFRHLFEHAPISILVVDLTSIPVMILEGNRRTELVYGHSAADLMGMPMARLVPEGALPELLVLVQAVQGGDVAKADSTSRRRDGTCFPVRLMAAPDPADARRMIVTVEDLTTEKQRRSEEEAIAAERCRIAHEIHDGVAQSLAGLRFKSAVWYQQAEDTPSRTRAILQEVQVVLTGAIVDLRRTIAVLRPPDLEALGFYPALAQLVSHFGEHGQRVAHLEVGTPPHPLPAVYELPLLRVIQEALNNISLHARATLTIVNLNVDATGRVALSVRDNGCSFDPTRLNPVDQPGHFGLRQMRERVLLLGGALDIHSAVGHGTEIVITLPTVVQELSHAAG